jgi:hypothetical protein
MSNYFVTMNDGKSGPEFWPLDRLTALKEIIESILNTSLFAPSSNGGFYVKQHRTVPKTHNYVPNLGVNTAHPLLILSTTYDPICPLMSARSANKAFADSQIVEVKGYGSLFRGCSFDLCCKARPGVFVQWHSPEECEVDGPYFIKLEEDGKVLAYGFEGIR